jgi:methylthioribulose 1-phosphate dehydratase/enolase-phosphatase E1
MSSKCIHVIVCLQAYELRDAGAVMHSHSANAVLATLLHPESSEFRCTNLEMIKGIVGHGYYDVLRVPIIENTARECELTDRMRAALLEYPKATAVLVRRHGVYVWGKTWIEAKTQAECYDYLFGMAVRMAGMGVDAAAVPKSLENGTNGRLENGHSPTKAEGALSAQSS